MTEPASGLILTRIDEERMKRENIKNEIKQAVEAARRIYDPSKRIAGITPSYGYPVTPEWILQFTYSHIWTDGRPAGGFPELEVGEAAAETVRVLRRTARIKYMFLIPYELNHTRYFLELCHFDELDKRCPPLFTITWVKDLLGRQDDPVWEYNLGSDKFRCISF
ncbi:hypothetical protein GLOTRDRAFT_125128 [Gloeophyllum trabeum ATCC 11539]|uniref:Uncharacterized protein n=1 Tax=Gloeophyllum trabeum (strain ATCC 11539 / FP-39264 / Madison 617) TaxID=670483 RepID=S7RZD3_GLOTA|nr:uncharacterized protein GLOTRDRAFT_125128 [Gloeophyllum trabeum ATCC 11539]EPQ58799.1 hypothetical protein GLOTRDRAFT_125128 [Gloeophyllum trabeum ATCC 11539]